MRDFPKISTGNGNIADLSATTNNRLELTIVELEKLNNNVSTSNIENKKLQQKIYWLTLIGVVIAIIQLVKIFL